MRLAVVVAVIVACHPEPAPPVTALHAKARWRAPAQLANVPASTPYVFALVDPPSEALRARLFGSVDRKVVETLQIAADLPLESRLELEPGQRALLAILDELRGQDPQRWWENLGFARAGHWTLYGLAIWPVLRIELADPARLRRVATRAIASLPMVQARRFGAIEYWIATSGELAIVGAVLAHDAVVAVLPTASLDDALPIVLGTKPPEHSLADGDDVPKLLRRHDLLSTMIGYIDTRRLAEALERTDALGPTPGLGTAACRADLGRLAATAPRIVMGYRQLDTQGFLASLVVETRPDIAAALAKVRTALPGVRADAHPLLAVSAAIDLDAALELARTWARELVAHPFTCGPLTALDDGARELEGVLGTPLPAWVHGYRGVELVVDDASQSPPSAIGHVLVIGDQVAPALGAILRQAGLGGAALAPDGRSYPLPVAMLRVPGLVSAHLAMRAGRAAIAVGDGSETRAAEVLGAPNAAQTPLVAIAWDVQRTIAQFPKLFDDKDIANMDTLGSVVVSLDARDDGIVVELGGTWNTAAR